MTLPLRWRIACAVTTTLLSVAALASPAGAANITTVTLGDQGNDTTIQGTETRYPLAAADITSSTATYKPAEITFTLVTGNPEDPRITPNWSSPATGISFLIRTGSQAPNYDYELRYSYINNAMVGAVYSATDTGRTNPLCAATMATFSSKVYRVGIDPGCISRPLTLSFAAAMTYKADVNNPDSPIVTDGPDNGGFSASLTRPRLGYWLVGRDGGIFAFGDAPFSGSTGNLHLNQPIVGMASNPVGTGYWFVAADGGIFAFGDAGFFGSTGAMKLNKPIVGMAPTPTGQGYWLVASDGGIFSFGDAKFRGSTGSLKLNKPIVGMAATPNGRGYWLVASDGGIFAFGNAAEFFGSTGSLKLAQPIVGMAATNSNKGYWFVAADGGIFAFGDAAKLTPTKLGGSPTTGVTPAPDGKGLWVTRADGTVEGYGSVPSLGSLPKAPNLPVVGVAGLMVTDPSAPAPAPAP
jgi:ribosomal protein L24E